MWQREGNLPSFLPARSGNVPKNREREREREKKTFDRNEFSFVWSLSYMQWESSSSSLTSSPSKERTKTPSQASSSLSPHLALLLRFSLSLLRSWPYLVSHLHTHNHTCGTHSIHTQTEIEWNRFRCSLFHRWYDLQRETERERSGVSSQRIGKDQQISTSFCEISHGIDTYVTSTSNARRTVQNHVRSRVLSKKRRR